jgi:hypothetical protein
LALPAQLRVARPITVRNVTNFFMVLLVIYESKLFTKSKT